MHYMHLLFILLLDKLMCFILMVYMSNKIFKDVQSAVIGTLWVELTVNAFLKAFCYVSDNTLVKCTKTFSCFTSVVFKFSLFGLRERRRRCRCLC